MKSVSINKCATVKDKVIGNSQPQLNFRSQATTRFFLGFLQIKQ